jgi:Bacterial PH domain
VSPPASPATDGVVRARPVRMARIGYASSAFVLVSFVVVAIVMPHANAGAHFGVKDQAATAVVGLILAGLLFMLTRPRLEADLTSVRMRSFLGGWRTVPWDVVVAVEFPSNVRFARLRLPAEEGFALYAVQRMDREQSIAVMRQLRALFDATRPPQS